MESSEQIDPEPEEQSWYSRINSKSWYEIMNSNHDEVSSMYIDLISDFSTLIKEVLNKKSNLKESKIIAFMRNIKLNLPEVISSFSEIPTRDSVEYIQEKEKEEKEDIICNLFSRVLNVFTKDNRSISELFQDIDINKDGKINFEEIRAEFFKYDSSITTEETKRVFEILDGDKDGSVSLGEFVKRMEIIKDRAEQEKIDPLSCIVISKPLDPELIHGNLSVILVKGEGLMQGGSNCIRIKVPEFLEYLTPETADSNPVLNFRADFLFENRTMSNLPVFINAELIFKGKVAGNTSFQWKKAMDSPNEFSVKTKAILKTSTGQSRGSLYFLIQWIPIKVKVYSKNEIDKLKVIEADALEHRKEMEENEYARKLSEKEYNIEPVSSPEEKKEVPIFEEQVASDYPSARYSYKISSGTSTTIKHIVKKVIPQPQVTNITNTVTKRSSVAMPSPSRSSRIGQPSRITNMSPKTRMP